MSGMAWMARLDARAAKWPAPTRWVYLAVKWYCVAFGAFALFRLWLDRTGIYSLY